MTEPSLSATFATDAVERRYRRTAFSLGPLDLELPRRGLAVLLGANGAGKSTLMHELLRRWTREGRSVSLLPQDARVPGRPTVHDLLRYGCVARGVKRSARPPRIHSLLESLDLANVKDRRLGTLSGGTLRRALIAESLIQLPEILILDEPTNGLDIHQRRSVGDHLRAISATTLVFVSTHVVADFSELADWVVVIGEGQILNSTTTAQFMTNSGQTSERGWVEAYDAVTSRA